MRSIYDMERTGDSCIQNLETLIKLIHSYKKIKINYLKRVKKELGLKKGYSDSTRTCGLEALSFLMYLCSHIKCNRQNPLLAISLGKHCHSFILIILNNNLIVIDPLKNKIFNANEYFSQYDLNEIYIYDYINMIFIPLTSLKSYMILLGSER